MKKAIKLNATQLRRLIKETLDPRAGSTLSSRSSSAAAFEDPKLMDAIDELAVECAASMQEMVSGDISGISEMIKAEFTAAIDSAVKHAMNDLIDSFERGDLES